MTDSWRPAASLSNLQARASLLTDIRDFFKSRNALEVETPILSQAGNTDPGIRQFTAIPGDWWLRTSPEYAMKRLLASGSGDIYELGRVFRAEENGRNHNQEFTMLEWYRLGWTYHQLMDEVEELVRHCMPQQSFRCSRISYRDLLHGMTGLDPMTASIEELGNCVSPTGIKLDGLDRNALLDLVISHLVQPRLPQTDLTFVYDYPAEQAALSRIRPGNPPLAERFELFLGSNELANGYQELNDPEEQKQRFQAEISARNKAGISTGAMDEQLLDALNCGLPDCAGVALGVDRLLMAILDVDSLKYVLAFPADRA